MTSPDSRAESGPVMTFSVADFAPPSADEDVFAEEAFSVQNSDPLKPPPKQPAFQERGRTERTVNTPRPRNFMDVDYPEWSDHVPPWRNPNPGGERYLYVWEQHAARTRGHH